VDSRRRRDAGEARSIASARGLAVAVATGAAFVLLAWVVAHWLWRWAAPASPVVLAPAPQDPAATIVASGLWAGGSDAPADAPTAAPADLALVGVLAERDGGGLAVFRTRDGARVVAAGAEIAPGTRLVAIDRFSVRLADAGGERTLELRREPAARGPAPAAARAPAAPARAPAAPTRAVAAGCAIPAGFTGAVLKLHGELLEGMIAQPESWRAMFAPDNGQIVVREEGGFATMLGLTRGDRLAQANGIALQQPDDVTGAVLRPLVASQPVRIRGSRNGAMREVLIQNAGACP
jgi:hypothetical protein